MALEIPRTRLNIRQIEQQKRNVPLQEIIAIEGQNPLAMGIETAGNVIGQALTKRAELRRQGEQLAKLEQLSGQAPGSYSGLDPATAATFTSSLIKQRGDNFTPQQLDAVARGDTSTMAKVFPNGVPKEAVTLALSGDRNRNLENERNTRQDDRLSAAAINYWKTLETNPVIKTLKQQDIGLSQVDQLVPLVQSGNTVASNALGAKMARGMGEVGVLTDSDIVRYVQSGQITQSAADKLSRMVKGVPTDTTLQEMQEISVALRTAYESKIQPLYNDAVVRFARNYKISPEEAAERLVIPYTGLRSIKKEGPKPFPKESPAERKARLLNELKAQGPN